MIFQLPSHIIFFKSIVLKLDPGLNRSFSLTILFKLGIAYFFCNDRLEMK